MPIPNEPAQPQPPAEPQLPALQEAFPNIAEDQVRLVRGILDGNATEDELRLVGAIVDGNVTENQLRLVETIVDGNATEDQLRLTGAILDGNDDLTRGLYAQKYGKLLKGTYDWAVIVLIISLGLATDLVASANNPDASGEWDTVFLGMSSSIIVLVSHMESWFKTHFIGADSAIGIVFALDRLVKSVKLALDGAKYITLPGWMLNVFMVFMIFLSKKHVSSATASILYINLALNCIVLKSYYPLFMMIVVLLYIRGDFTTVDGLLRNHKNLIASGFAILLAVIFGYIQYKSYKDEPLVKQFLNTWLNRSLA